MPPLRPTPRPSIPELSNFLLGRPLRHRTPTSCPARYISSARASRLPSKALKRQTSAQPQYLSLSHSFSATTSHSLTSTPKPPPSSSHTPKNHPPKSHDRGPASTEETQTDFGAMNVLGNMPAPSTSIDACLGDGFHLNSGVKVEGGRGVLLVGGEAFSWSPWEVVKDGSRVKKLLNEKGQWHVEDEAWGLLELVWPKPDLLILGLGPSMHPISPKTRQYINSLGIRVDIQDTRNAAAQFNLLATERGVNSVAAALVPIGWREGRGAR